MASDKFSSNTNTKGVVKEFHAVKSAIDTTSDTDWFKVTLKRGNTYQFNLRGAASGKGTLTAGSLELYNASGLLAGAAQEVGPLGEAQLGFTANTNGTFFIAAGGDGTDTGTYSLKFGRRDIGPQAGGGPGIGEGTDTEGKISIGQTKNGHLLFTADQDWYAVNLKANTDYKFSVMEATTSTPSAVFTPGLTVLDASGNPVAGASYDLVTDPTGTTATLSTGGTGGKYFLAIYDRNTSNGEDPGYYTLAAGFNVV